jgi:hypothetical protein
MASDAVPWTLSEYLVLAVRSRPLRRKPAAPSSTSGTRASLERYSLGRRRGRGSSDSDWWHQSQTKLPSNFFRISPQFFASSTTPQSAVSCSSFAFAVAVSSPFLNACASV